MIECIPNFSEGRRQEVIDAIVASITAIVGVTVLDTHADADHNRTVVTFAGEADAVAEAAFQAVRTAARLIDMNEHRGAHPRVGATDVLPFVPLRGATIDQCVALARAVGKRVGEELEIPVYLYEAAASRPDRVALPDVRRGEYEGLRDAITSDPQRAPDFGPARLGSAGATIVGARPPLIAYNVYLNSADVGLARRIAKAVRGSSGGLRGVRALGLLVNDRAQVSMNLTDYRTTAIHRAVEMVAREAAAFGATIVESELVGLIPEDALLDAARFYLRLHTMHDEQLLERRIAERQAAMTAPAVVVEPRALASWDMMVETLGRAAHELAEGHAHATPLGGMLHTLGQELCDLARRQPEDDSARAAVRRLLLIAERAVKVVSLLPGVADTGAAVSDAAGLARLLTVGAQQRALPLLVKIGDAELRANFEHEFESHVHQAAQPFA